MPKKIVKTPGGFEITLFPANNRFTACCECCENIAPGQYYAVCSNCGGIFCEACVTAGNLETHDCD